MFQRAITIEPLSVVDRGGSVGPKRQGEMSLARVLLADIDSSLEQVFNGINVTAADECGEVQMHDNGVRRRALVDDIKDTVGNASFLLLQGADRCVDRIDYAGSGRQPETFELCACIGVCVLTYGLHASPVLALQAGATAGMLSVLYTELRLREVMTSVGRKALPYASGGLFAFCMCSPREVEQRLLDVVMPR